MNNHLTALTWLQRQRGRCTIVFHPATGWTATVRLSTYPDATANEPDFEAVCLWLETAINGLRSEFDARRIGK